MITQKNILLVDDDSVFNFINSTVISSAGLASEIQTAQNGEEALTFFNHPVSHKKGIPEVVLLDLNMPIMDGFEFIQAFQRLDFPGKDKVIIIVVTSSMNPDDIRRAKSFGIKHYLTKPISEEGIQTAIEAELFQN